MTDPRNEDVTPLSPEALQFLREHDDVGTPTPAELRRVRERVLTKAPADNVVPLRRAWLPPEVWAVAAVVVLAVAGQLIYLSLRGRGDAQLNTAWSSGWVEQLNAAVASCSDDACRARGGKMLAAMALGSRVSTLDDAELTGLETLDAELSRDATSPLAARVAERRRELLEPKKFTAEQRFERGLARKKQGDFDGARDELEACVKESPHAHPCWRLLGAAWAAIGSRDASAEAMARAQKAYETFLDVAPADDPYVPRITAILDATESDVKQDNVEVTVLKLVKGVKTTVVKPGLARVAVGDPGVVDIATLGGNQLQFQANETGTTTVLLWFTDGSRQTVTVKVE